MARTARGFLPSWTIMVYLNAKNDREPHSFKTFEQMAKVGSTPNVRILVEYGRPQRHYPEGETPPFGGWSKTLRFAVGKDMEPTEDEAVEDLGQVNMADPKALADFVHWGMTWSAPSAANMLVIWNPGPSREKVHNGFWYVSYDEDTGDKLYMREIQEVLARYNRHFHVIGFDAGLAGMLENAYALRESGSIMVGSEDVEPGDGWSYDGFLEPLVANPREFNPESVARLMVDSYRNHYGDREAATLSAIDLTRVTPLAKAVSQFGHLPDDDALHDYFEAIRQARNACRDYGYGPEVGVSVNSIDLGRFLEQVTRVPDVGKGLAKTAANAKAALEDLVIDNYASSLRQGEFGSHGLAIYFPGHHLMYHLDPDCDAYRPGNTVYPVEFVARDDWSHFVHSYMTWMSYPI
jgi:hypothetical protein